MNVLVVGCDTLGAGHCGCYGYHRDTTPHLDQLARRGVRLANHYTVAPTCTPSWTSLITGWAPVRHRVSATLWMWENLRSQILNDAVPTVAELFQEAGFTTAAFSFLHHLMAHFPTWFVRGYEYHINPNRARLRNRDMSCTSADEMNRRLFPWLEQHRDEPFFAFLTYWEPHQPYYHTAEFAHRFEGDELPTVDTPGGAYIPGFGLAAHLNERTRRDLDRYDRSVAYVDDRLGRLVDKLADLDLLDDTLIMVTSDHGECMMEHGIAFEHRGQHDPTVRVPMVFCHPSLPAGRVVSTGTQATDLTPTLLHLAGLAGDFTDELGQMDGRSLAPELRGETDGPADWAIVTEQAEDMAATRALHTPEWTWIRRFMETVIDPPVRYRDYDAPQELYHRATDPWQTVNVVAKHPEVAAAMDAQLLRWVADRQAPGQCDPLLDPLLLELNALHRRGHIRWRWEERRGALKKTRDPRAGSAPEREG
ncbi:MAG: sulfatase [Armatimonadetes bacterium]|nr:sulfatase [Armatimonadota bacterium]